MSIGDLVIIYLAFGAPFAVYKYLHTRDVGSARRLTVSILTLLFWIPAAARIGYRSLSNAYSEGAFVSRNNLDAREDQIAVLREKIRSELVHADRGSFSTYTVREIIERYIGLTSANNIAPQQVDEVSTDLFRAAGRSDDKLAKICLIRRNQRTTNRHHIRARRDLFALFEQALKRDPAAAETAVGCAVQLATLLGDRKAVEGLEAIAAQIKDEVWNPEGQQSILGDISVALPRLSMKTVPSNND